MSESKRKSRSAKKKSTGRLWYLLLLIPAVVYFKGLAPTVVLGDTGDFLTAGWIGGIAHPPGYPLYTVLVGIFERLPISPPAWVLAVHHSAPAWRAGLLSAIFALGTIAAMFALVNRLTKKTSAALIAAGVLAFSRVFWWHAEIAENDSLSALFLVLILLLSVRYAQERRYYDPFLIAFILGLAISHQQALILFVPAALIYLIIRKALFLQVRHWITLVLVFLIGLAPLLYLPITQYRNPAGPIYFVSEPVGPVETGADESAPVARYTDSTRLEYFIKYVTRSIYGRMRDYTHSEEALEGDKTTTGDVFFFYVQTLLADFSYVFAIIGFVGLFNGWWRRPSGVVEWRGSRTSSGAREGWLMLIFAWGIYFLVLHFYPSGDILRAPQYLLETAGPGLMLPLEVVFAALVGLGINVLLDRIDLALKNPELVKKAILVICLLLIAFNAVSNYRYSDKSQSTLAHEYCLNVLDSCPENAALVVAGDELYAFWYMHYVHPDPETGEPGYRPDVRLVGWADEVEDLSELSDIGSAMANAVVRTIEAEPDREVSTTFFHSRFLETPELSGYTIARRGILFSFVQPDSTSELSPVNPELVEQTSVEFYDPAIPGQYRWDFWGGNAMTGEDIQPITGRWFWPPEADIRWRISAMLRFYGSNAHMSGNGDLADEYFRQMMLVEPEHAEAWEDLATAVENSE